MTRFPKPIFRCASYALLFSVLAACTVVELTRPVVKIGLVGPFEGPYRYAGYDAVYAARLALREANASGGVGGYSVELVAFDDQGSIDGAVTAARNLTLDSQVVSVIGHYRDETTEAAQALYDQAGMPVMLSGTVEGDSGSQHALLCPLLDYLRNALQTKADDGELHVQWFTHDRDGNEAVLACSDRLSVTVSTRIPPLPNVDVILMTLDPITAAEILVKVREAGWEGVVAGGPELGSPLFARILFDRTRFGKTGGAWGIIFASPYRWPDVEGRDSDFAARYQSLGPHVSRPGPFAVTTYEATQTLLAAIEFAVRQGETPTRQTLPKYLAQPSTTRVYVYRWMPTGTLELIEEIVFDPGSAE